VKPESSLPFITNTDRWSKLWKRLNTLKKAILRIYKKNIIFIIYELNKLIEEQKCIKENGNQNSTFDIIIRHQYMHKQTSQSTTHDKTVQQNTAQAEQPDRNSKGKIKQNRKSHWNKFNTIEASHIYIYIYPWYICRALTNQKRTPRWKTYNIQLPLKEESQKTRNVSV
jgi:hypothetical protein